MTAINKNNYEVFFLDFIEGRLNKQQLADLEVFLKENPELRDELEGLEAIRIEPDSKVNFEAKGSLKMAEIIAYADINESNYEEFFIADGEGDLSESARNDLEIFIATNPHLEKEFHLFHDCHIQPDTRIVFNDKSSLKKGFVLPLQRIYYGLAIAASLALLIGLGFLFYPTNNQQLISREQVTIPHPESQDVTQQVAVTEPAMQEIPERPGQALQIEERIATQTIAEPIVADPIERKIITLTQLASLSASVRIEINDKPEAFTEMRNYFSGYYHDIFLAQSIRHDEPLMNQASTERLLAQGSALVREIVQPGEEDIQVIPERINLWKVADIGINGFALLTGADIEFRKDLDEDGKVRAFALQGQSLNISRNLNRNR